MEHSPPACRYEDVAQRRVVFVRRTGRYDIAVRAAWRNLVDADYPSMSPNGGADAAPIQIYIPVRQLQE